MKKYTLLLVGCAAIMLASAQPYQPNWNSLDQRPTPQWFRDGKFGIFIHWGVYAVPGFSVKGEYAEWYQHALNSGDSARVQYHRNKFGNLTYYQLADQFKAELFQPDEWARLFEQSGARYIVLTSKHHDGFALWPSKEASKSWGFPWNAAEVGPKRDLIKDLFTAVRKTKVHAGMYYSLYEWYNPIWKSNREKYVTEHMWPQMKDLINNYQPDVFWTDGDWDAPAETWKSQEFLTWLYNESPVKDRVVVNDRWGAGLRFHHGGIYTPEYQPDLDFENHYWEESRGMGFSYGYNREEDAWDYNSTQSLILQLVDKVSSGGNFLLDIGPDEHGKIPPIMQERLLQIGDWLKLNGEAIYNTVRWKTPSQWSEGKRDYKPANGSGDLLLKLTVDPEPGYAVKEMFFTYNPSDNNLYGIFPKYPENGKLLLKSVQLPAGTQISLLAPQQILPWEQQGDNVLVHLPAYSPSAIKAPWAFAIKIAGYGRFAAKPSLQYSYNNPMQPEISFSNAGKGTIHYTTDGSEPNAKSPVYTKPFLLAKSAVVQAINVTEGEAPSGIAAQKINRYEWMPSVKASSPQPGIAYRYYEPEGGVSMASLQSSPVVKEGVTAVFSNAVKQRKSKFALVFEGYIRISKDELYSFFTNSDDGSKLFIDGLEVVDNDGNHGATEKSGKGALKKGLHKIMVQYFDAAGDNSLEVSMQAGAGKKMQVPASVLFH